ncbi:MAG: NADH-quinone oxidoreductase subunit C [Bacteroidetes bacterium]|nr:NADH-quinone oxidoreductase subunit C [Bacteroidota bacterium]
MIEKRDDRDIMMVVMKSNPFVVQVKDIPVLDYPSFMDKINLLMADEGCHIVTYHAVPLGAALRFFCCIASDSDHLLILLSHEQQASPLPVLDSLTVSHPSFHMFEREIREQYGVEFTGHPWMKPVRLHNLDAGCRMQDAGIIHPASRIPYPFYSIEGEGIHEVGVGPIHAGIIEPGYFRFSCNGEKVLHLEIQLGFQHRGIESIFLEKHSGIQRAVLAESISGDTAVGHSIAHAQLLETLAGITPAKVVQSERIIALELERIAVHIGDTAALCTDIAYQFGQVVNEALRTIIINTTQSWCGNRFGKGLVRTGGSHYPLSGGFIKILLSNLKEVEERYGQITHEMFTNPSVLSRFEGIGKVSARQAGMIGAVGMAARSSGVNRDIRWSHPFQAFTDSVYEPVTLHQGDVWARAMLRKQEVEKSILLIRDLLTGKDFERDLAQPLYEFKLQPASFALSLAEGWRGEIMHSAVTDQNGNIIHYKVKDPSFHNWMALALAVRNQEISDFPLCNKSFNLSYCGNDL